MARIKMEYDEETVGEKGPSVGSRNQRRFQPPKLTMAFAFLSKLKNEKSPQVWEKSVAKILPILDDLEPVCADMASCPKLEAALKDAAVHWLNQIADIRERAERVTNVVIGVFGNTGDGKSSTINALLGEASLLPTNCMRACTACVTEISFNDNDDVENPYRAEVVFVSPNEWREEIKTFLAVAAASCEGSGEDGDTTGEGLQAVAKTRAVYASMEEGVLYGSTEHELMCHPNVREVLGTIKSIKAPSGDDLRALIEPFIDSTDKGDEEGIAFWPMVKAVRIFTKAKALSNGVTIVDLPGHQDWDAARASVAKHYMKSCSGIWIVAPIHRAVDSKTAKDLMGDAFRRQLKVDGSFSAVTFVCSKADEIRLTDAMKDLKSSLGPEARSKWQKCQKLQKQAKKLEVELKALEKRSDETRESDDTPRPERSAKRPKTEKVALKMKEIENLKAERDEILEALRSECIQKRNELSRDTLKRYFSSLVKEVEEKGAEEDSENASDGLDNISRNLPVFCVSSHAYQNMEGLSDDDNNPTSGFSGPEDTEIPQLQEHAQKITEELRVAKYREVLSKICQFVNSICFWTQNVPESSATINAEELDSMLAKFEERTHEEAAQCVAKLAAETDRVIFQKMASLAVSASARAQGIASGWAVPPSQGGIFHSTLRATFARNGAWKRLELNEDLLASFTKGISDDWSKFFQLEFPIILDGFTIGVAHQLLAFHERVAERMGEDYQEDLQAMEQLKKQQDLHKDSILRLITRSKAEITKAQKDANRVPHGVIVRHMVPGYQNCLLERGSGSVKRMNDCITTHVARERKDMFSSVVNETSSILQEAMAQFVDNLHSHMKGIKIAIRNDYTMALAEREQSARHEEGVFKENMSVVLEAIEPRLK